METISFFTFLSILAATALTDCPPKTCSERFGGACNPFDGKCYVLCNNRTRFSWNGRAAEVCGMSMRTVHCSSRVLTKFPGHPEYATHYECGVPLPRKDCDCRNIVLSEKRKANIGGLIKMAGSIGKGAGKLVGPAAKAGAKLKQGGTLYKYADNLRKGLSGINNAAKAAGFARDKLENMNDNETMLFIDGCVKDEYKDDATGEIKEDFQEDLDDKGWNKTVKSECQTEEGFMKTIEEADSGTEDQQFEKNPTSESPASESTSCPSTKGSNKGGNDGGGNPDQTTAGSTSWLTPHVTILTMFGIPLLQS